MKQVTRRLILWSLIPVILAGLAFGWFAYTRYKNLRDRAAWKTTTLERLASISLSSEEVVEELKSLKTSRAVDESKWTGEQILVMTNNEFLVFAWRHGSQSSFVDNLFLAHGSDGRWYYSTYHFCNHMAGVGSDDPPGSISEFVSKYAVREFDGKSDICLQHTWPPRE